MITKSVAVNAKLGDFLDCLLLAKLTSELNGDELKECVEVNFDDFSVQILLISR